MATGLRRTCWVSADTQPPRPAEYRSASRRGSVRAALIVANNGGTLLKVAVVCAEPSADGAKALSSAVAAAVSGGSGDVNPSLSGGGASLVEAIAKLAGRWTALLGLREACAAFANGVFGSDAYALLLSRYGQLITQFLGPDISAGAVDDCPDSARLLRCTCGFRVWIGSADHYRICSARLGSFTPSVWTSTFTSKALIPACQPATRCFR